jgi:hypothetical protein
MLRDGAFHVLGAAGRIAIVCRCTCNGKPATMKVTVGGLSGTNDEYHSVDFAKWDYSSCGKWTELGGLFSKNGRTEMVLLFKPPTEIARLSISTLCRDSLDRGVGSA